MDTTCADITTEVSVQISGYTILDLNGIQYFDALTTLICGNNSLNSVPYLPQNLDELNVQNNDLTTIPNIPPTVSILRIG